VTGDLDVTRDFTDVRDVIRAYFALLASGRTGEIYNIASGRETRLGELLSMLLEVAGVEARCVTDPARSRPAEQRRVRANVAKIRRDTGWEPRIALSESLRSTLDYWKKNEMTWTNKL
jgi:GDP-4-dehydro-6-deoxy-D-mannose reductase